MNRIGIIGDVHAHDDALALALAFLATQKLDALLCTGDVADGPGDVDRCCRLLRDAGVLCVRGNHDRWLVQEQLRDLPNATSPDEISGETFAFLRDLPSVREFSTPRGALLLCHGLGKNDMAQLRPHDEGYALEVNDDLHKILQAARWRDVVGGHTHQAMLRRFDAAPAFPYAPLALPVTFLNAGMLVEDGTAVCTVVDCSENRVCRYRVESAPTLLSQSDLL